MDQSAQPAPVLDLCGIMLYPTDDSDHPLAKRFTKFIGEAEFPCVGAKSALVKGHIRFVVGRDLRSAWDDLRIYPNLLDLARSYSREPTLFHSLAVLFEQDGNLDETAFEACLWARLASLTDKDDWHGQTTDPRVSADPDDPHFSLSFGGEAFFVVGLHPRASRPARRFERPALIFNLHDQFEQLRASGVYDKMRSTIIARDVALAGDPNPMLARHGTVSEARQYSGRAVGEDWICPFRAEAAVPVYRIPFRAGAAERLPAASTIPEPAEQGERLRAVPGDRDLVAIRHSPSRKRSGDRVGSLRPPRRLRGPGALQWQCLARRRVSLLRTGIMAAAVASPFAGDYRELARMAPEKIGVF